MPAVTTVTMCARCRLRPGIEVWVGDGGALGYVHGMYALWCRVCVTEAQLEAARSAAARVPALEQQLEDLRRVQLARAVEAWRADRAALVKVRAHTSYQNPSLHLLMGLLASIERIVDAALAREDTDATHPERDSTV